MSTVELTCAFCGKDFVITKNAYNQRQWKLPNNPNFFCSKSCTAKNRNANRDTWKRVYKPGPQYGNAHSQKYPPGTGWYVRRFCNDRRFSEKDTLNESEEKRIEIAHHLEDLWQQQKGCCTFSSVSLVRRQYTGKCSTNDPFRVASVDRIDNTQPYQVGNIQWVSVAMNQARGDLPINEFRKYLKNFMSHGE